MRYAQQKICVEDLGFQELLAVLEPFLAEIRIWVQDSAMSVRNEVSRCEGSYSGIWMEEVLNLELITPH